MPESSSKLVASMDSPWFWFLLIIPATVALLAYQLPEHARTTDRQTVIEQPTGKRPVAPPPASEATMPPRQSGTARDGAQDAGAVETYTAPEDRGASVQSPSIGVAQDANNAVPANEPAVELAEKEPSGSPANADLASVIEENPYLPVAGENYDEDYSEPLPADGDASPCPQVLFRGGDAYAVNRLALMGCEIPGG